MTATPMMAMATTIITTIAATTLTNKIYIFQFFRLASRFSPLEAEEVIDKKDRIKR